MASLYQDDEDEKFKQMLGGIIGGGPAPYDVQTSMEMPDAPEQSGLSAPYMPQSAGSIGGYTPPPAAAAPAYMDHVEGHQFGAGDIAMLGGILAALVGGGKHRGEIAGSLAGQYGGAVMQNNARADQRNQQVDQYNNQLENKANDPMERWKAEQGAKYQSGNLETRGKELTLQQQREQRIADQQAAEDARDPVAEAERIARARGNVDLDITRQKNDMEVGTREMLGQILGKQKGEYAAPGKAGAATTTPEKELKHKLAQAQLDGIDAGTVDPLTGKPKPGTTPTKSRTPFADTEFENEELFGEKNGTAGNYQKNSDTDAELTKGIAAMRKMKELVEKHGSQWGSDEDSARIKGEFDTAKGVVQSSQAKLRALGVLQQKEQEKVDDAIGADIGPGMSDLTSRVGLGDLRVGRLDGAIKSFTEMQDITRHANGVRAKTKAAEKPLGESGSGKVSFSVDPEAEKSFNSFGPGNSTGKPDSGQRTVTVTYTDGETESFTGSDADIQRLRGKSAVRSVQ